MCGMCKCLPAVGTERLCLEPNVERAIRFESDFNGNLTILIDTRSMQPSVKSATNIGN